MKLLFSFYMPSGGMGTLNRIRRDAFHMLGHDCRLLYTTQHQEPDDIYLTKLFERETFDLVTVSSDYTLLEKIRKSGYTGPLIYEVQGYGPPDEGEKVMVSAKRFIETYADAVLYPRTGHLSRLFRQHIPSLPHYSFDNPLDSVTMRYRKYPPKQFPIIGWVGRIEYNKNWMELLELVSRLVPVYPELSVWMFGDAKLDNQWERSQFNARVKALGLTRHMIRHSNVPNDLMADYYSIIGDSGGFLCSTSILEGFGYAVCEAMLCRCPVLSSSSDGVNRMITHKKTGMLYPSGDTDIAYQMARTLMEDLPLRQRIRRAGMLHIRSRFRPERYVDSFVGMAAELQRRLPPVRDNKPARGDSNARL